MAIVTFGIFDGSQLQNGLRRKALMILLNKDKEQTMCCKLASISVDYQWKCYKTLRETWLKSLKRGRSSVT